jgi:hypothetical protein
MKTVSFSASVHRLGINFCVDVPALVVAALLRAAKKKAGPIPVKCRLGATQFMSTVLKYRGDWRLYLNAPERRSAAIDAGDSIKLKLTFDAVPRMPPMPIAFRKSLANNETASRKWRLQPSAKRRAILESLNADIDAAGLEAAIVKLVDRLSRTT